MSEENGVIGHESANADQNAGGLETLVAVLKDTKPWLLFIGVMGFILCGLLVILGFGALVIFGTSSAAGRGEPVWLGFLYIAGAALYFFPSLYLYRAANAIRDLEEKAGKDDIYWPLQFMYSFWRFCGIVMIIVAAIYSIVFIYLLASSLL